ncbi:hypothetical protein JCM8208_000860 [Rhodotorula glutinis]
MRCPSHALLVAPRPVRPVTTLDVSSWPVHAPASSLHILDERMLDASSRRIALPRRAHPSWHASHDDERVATTAALGRHERMAAHHGSTFGAVVEVDEVDERVKVTADDEALLLVLARSSSRAVAAVTASSEGSARSKRRSFRPSLGSIHERGAGEDERGEDDQEAAERMGSSEGSELAQGSVSSSCDEELSMSGADTVTPASSLAPDSSPARTGSPSSPPSPPPPTTPSLPLPASLVSSRPTPSSNPPRPSHGALRTLVKRLLRLPAQVRRRSASAGSCGEAARRAGTAEGVWVVVEVEQMVARELCENGVRR